MADNWMLGESAALDDYIPNAPTNILGNAAQGVKDWYTSQPSWLDRAKAENQKTIEAYGRGGMGEIAKQLATDTTEAQDLVSAFGVGNIKGVRPQLAPGALAATSEYRPPFYSAVEQAVQGAKQNAAPGQQWAGFLRNQPGVKPEEVEALKLGKLFEQPGSVPKEAVLGEIAANRVNVGEVVRGGSEYDLQPKFSQYTLPGGENYREMLLTLPQRQGPKWQVWQDEIARLRNKYGENFYGPNSKLTQQEKQNLEQLHRGAGHGAGDPGLNYTSSHYDEPNILAHVRYNDRVIDGKKTLFVEEVQSDWHQKGKRQGYKEGEPQTIPSFTADQLKIHETEHQYVGTTPDGRQQVVGKGTVGDEDGAREYLTRYMNKMAAERNMSAAQAHQAKVPDAPFKTTWPDLAMKRVIREAAEKGYDKVAWTPGSVQAERYDLSKHIDKVSYDGQRLWAWKKGEQGTPAINQRVTPEGLADVIGKDAAEKLMQQPEQKMAKFAPGETGKYRTLVGADLKIGGEGMKGFYDEILPATVNRLVKKHGGRVQQGEIQGHQFKGYQSYSAGEGPTGAPAVFGVDHTGAGRIIRQDFSSIEEARTAAKELNAGGKKQPVHTLDITPSLRAAAMKGFPLFTAGGIAATGIMGEMARQDEYR